MAIAQSTLRQTASQTVASKAATLNEAMTHGIKTAFLCHSHLDATLAQGLAKLLKKEGWDIYIDWLDNTMPNKPNRTTAKKIQGKIVLCDYFLFLATQNSMRSRWCPWEIGYADGTKNLDTIFVIPTKDTTSSYGNEYLDLYQNIDFAKDQRLATWEAGRTTGGRYIASL